MTLDDIPADVPFDMTDDLVRLFRIADCDPACHACLNQIKVGDSFELAAGFDDQDHMLCGECTIQDYERRTAERAAHRAERRQRERQEYFDETGRWPGYSRPSQSTVEDKQ